MGILAALGFQAPSNTRTSPFEQGFSLPQLFSPELSSKLGVLGANLTNAGFGHGVDANAMLNATELNDKRKAFDKLQREAKRYADSIRAHNPELAAQIDADPSEMLKIAGENRQLQHQKQLKDYEIQAQNAADPSYQFKKQLANMMTNGVGGDAGGTQVAGPTGDVPTLEPIPGAPPPPSAAVIKEAIDPNGPTWWDQAFGKKIPPTTGTPEDNRQFNIEVTPGQENNLSVAPDTSIAPTGGGPPDVAPAAAAPPAGNAKIVSAMNQIFPGLNPTPAEAMALAQGAMQNRMDSVYNSIIDNRRQSQATVAATGQAAQANQWKIDEENRKAAAVKQVGTDYEKSLPNLKEIQGPMPGTAPQDETRAQQMMNERIFAKAGLPPELRTQANAEILHAAAQAGPKEYQSALMDIANPKAGTSLTMDKNGVTTFTQGGPAGKGAKPTEFTMKALGYVEMMKPELKRLPSVFTAMTEKKNYVGDQLKKVGGRYWMTEEGQRAADSFDAVVEPVLRQVSGATLTDTEVQRKLDALRPSPADDPKTLSDKRERLDALNASMHVMAGLEVPPSLFEAPAAGKAAGDGLYEVGTVKGDYKYIGGDSTKPEAWEKTK